MAVSVRCAGARRFRDVGVRAEVLVALSTGGGFTPFGNRLHAPGFGWAGMKVVTR